MDVSFFVIRPARKGDEETCRIMVRTGIAAETDITFREMFRRKDYYLWCAAVAAMSVLFVGGDGLNPMFIICMTIPFVAFLAYVALWLFYYREVRLIDADLTRLQENYLQSVNSQFFVCEYYEMRNRNGANDVKPRFVTLRELNSLAPDVLDAMTATIVGTIGVIRDTVGNTLVDGRVLARDGESMVGHIRRLSVSPDFRGRGIASRLADAIIQFCSDRNYSFIELDTSEFNEASQRLFTGKGFKVAYTWYKRFIPILPVITIAFVKMQFSVGRKQ